MKWLVVLGFLLLALRAPAQWKPSDEKLPDPEYDPQALAQSLTGHLSSDREKVKAIFYWITDNIAYRTRPVLPPPRKKKNNKIQLIEEDNDTAALKPLDERVAERVLQDRQAVCDGYARLFKTLCTYSGLQAEVIQGYARTTASRRIQLFRPNHSWNAVKIDSVWYLLDVTWASGYILMPSNQFVRHLDNQYFLTRPEEFIREHYPEDLKWALMDDPPLMPEFRHSPFKQKSFTKYQITAYSPEKGIIEVSQGDTIYIQLHTNDPAKDKRVSSDPFLDTAMYNTGSMALLVPEHNGNFISYTYIANSPAVQWLYILYNDDIIMRYRLKFSTLGNFARTEDLK